MNARPHVAQNANGRSSADRRPHDATRGLRSEPTHPHEGLRVKAQANNCRLIGRWRIVEADLCDELTSISAAPRR